MYSHTFTKCCKIAFKWNFGFIEKSYPYAHIHPYCCMYYNTIMLYILYSINSCVYSYVKDFLRRLQWLPSESELRNCSMIVCGPQGQRIQSKAEGLECTLEAGLSPCQKAKSSAPEGWGVCTGTWRAWRQTSKGNEEDWSFSQEGKERFPSPPSYSACFQACWLGAATCRDGSLFLSLFLTHQSFRDTWSNSS